MKAVIKYPGSKWSMAEWIINHFPEHHSYLEPFCGNCAVLFNKPRSHIETINDLDGAVANLFECIRKDPERLAHDIYFTPYSRQIYERAFEATIPDDPFEWAVQFCIRLNQGHGFRTNGERVGWKNDVVGRERAYAAKDWCTLPERIVEAAERLRGVQIEHMDAVELIKRFNHSNVLIYADPPYMLQTRHGKQYRCEMDDQQHERLLDALEAHTGPVILSGYDSPLYAKRLRKWHREERTAYSQIASRKTEVIWMNFDPAGQQMRLDI